MSLLEVEDLSVDFGTDDGVVHAVRNVSFSLESGEVLGIVGESGCGKSVSASAIMGLLPRTATVHGSIRLGGQEMVGRSAKELRTLRGNRVAMIFQDPMTSLNPVLQVGWQLAEAYRAHHKVSGKVARAKAVEALDQVGIPQPDRRAKQYPHEFSGGMRQRAMIAMALINEPELIIADEPTTALDVTVQAQILDTLLRLSTGSGASIMLITHDLGVVAGTANRVQVMYGGTVVETASVDELFAHPRMPYTVGLLGSVPNPDQVGKRLTPIHGAPPSPLHLPPGCSFGPRCPLVHAGCLESEPQLFDVGTDHWSRCYRWNELSGDRTARELFDQAEIGLGEAPAADLVAPGEEQ
ncbi:ABC transporter ATP-binding protein [Pseudonocardia spinosispora]|uniref:ABC transporter ATP-binding protein n=1 Tax=Pseudonocardia spinosispora TaxID=103441 RepID=UPI00040E9763|nr:ABC transporter ATP-binding protein [Pseudonocardia spinosispora]